MLISAVISILEDFGSLLLARPAAVKHLDSSSALKFVGYGFTWFICTLAHRSSMVYVIMDNKKPSFKIIIGSHLNKNFEI